MRLRRVLGVGRPSPIRHALKRPVDLLLTTRHSSTLTPCRPRTGRRPPLQVLGLRHQRSFFTDDLPPVLVPPVLFTTLLLSLWAYKCFMTVVFQDRIIYMPYMPPFTRSEKLADYVADCKPVEWETKHIKSLDGTKLAICIGKIPNAASPVVEQGERVVICYFHGNGGSIPPRLPMLSNVLKALATKASLSQSTTEYSIVALSYRGYWESAGRASQRGIEADAKALLEHVNTSTSSTGIILWGQSIGAGVASTAAAAYLSRSDRKQLPLAGLVMETPFTSIKAMLLALYPQKWLPYQYLHPFLWNHWDSEAALKTIAGFHESRPKLLLLPATRDEVVPAEEVTKLQSLSRELGLDVTRRNVMGALHTEATTRREGQEALAEWVVESASQ